MSRNNLDDEPQSGFWIFVHPRELHVFKNAASDPNKNPKRIKPFYEQFYMVLREYMEGGTRLVRCSWEGLRTAMETPTVSGSHDPGGKPSLKQLRHGAEYLQKIDLIEIKSVDRQLIFFLKKAPTKREIDGYRESRYPGGGAEEGHMSRAEEKSEENTCNKASIASALPGRKVRGENARRGSHPSISSIPIDTNIDIYNSLPVDTSSNPKNKNAQFVQEIFEHWQTVMNHHGAKLDEARKRKIESALKLGYSVEQLKNSIDGCAKSAWHQGQNDKNAIYDGIALIFRNAENIERFISYNNEVTRNENYMGRRNIHGSPQRQKTATQRSAELWNYLTGRADDDEESREKIINP